MFETAKKSLAPALVALLVGGCSLMPHERAASPELPTAWRDAPVGATTSLTDWWTQFQDPLLNRLVAEALTDGPSLRLAVLRVQEARGVNQSTIANTLPSLDAQARGSFTRARTRGQGLPAFDGTLERQQMTGTFGPSVSWEVPLFGRILQAAAGARANTESAIADARGARVTLIADVAQAYVDLRAAQNTRASLEESLRSAEQLASILDTSLHAGIASQADAADAHRLAEGTRARVAGAVIQERAAENRLAVLRGRAPGTEPDDVMTALDQIAAVPSLPLTEAPAAPADMLRLRPDVARAEAQVLLSAAALGSARTDLLPQLNLSGSINVTDNLIGNPLPGRTETLTGAPFISIPLFDWGARRAQVRVRDVQFHETLIQYRQTVTEAVSESSNALTSLDQGARRLTAARAAEAAAEQTARGRRAAYSAGINSLVDRLRADQDLIDAKLTRVDAEASEASAAINVYRAFGGGGIFERR